MKYKLLVKLIELMNGFISYTFNDKIKINCNSLTNNNKPFFFFSFFSDVICISSPSSETAKNELDGHRHSE